MTLESTAGTSDAAGASPTVLDILRKSTGFLKSHGCDAPRLESELLLAKALRIKRLDLYLQFDRPLVEHELSACRELIRRRSTREPLAYILGEREFRSLVFEVDRNVFIPRPDTETVVDAVLEYMTTRNLAAVPLLGADIGTGSGCLAVSLAHALPQLQMIATDVSRGALAVAARNARRNHVEDRIQFVATRGLEGVAGPALLDLIVCNPPYVLSTELASLQPELAYEPRLALCPARDDVDAVFVAIAAAAALKLKPGGAVFIEIGEGQAPGLERAFAEHGFTETHRRRDLGGIDRVVAAVRHAAPGRPVDSEGPQKAGNPA